MRRTIPLLVALTALVGPLLFVSPASAQTPPPPRPPLTQPPPTQPFPSQPPPTQPPFTQPPPTVIGPTPTTTPTSSGSGRGGLIVFLALLVAGIGGGLAYALVRRPSAGAAPGTATATPMPAAPTSVATTGRAAAVTDELLEVSRRLTAAAATGDVKRAIVRGSLSLVPADDAALVTVAQGGSLAVGAETRQDLLVSDHLGDGLIARVAETGQHVVQVSATEPALRQLPAAMIAVPLVGGGRVEAVLVVLRHDDQPFSAPETRTLQSLAPMAAAALHNERQSQAALEASLVDALTGLGNRRRFDSDVATALAATGPTGFVIVDLDHFKKVNDTHGHPAGDALLRAAAGTIRDTLRPGDTAYRYGGEEFCILLPNSTAADAAEVAERVRAEIEAGRFDVGAAQPLQVTASFGVAASDGREPAAALIDRADTALYASKREGRNRVTVG